MGTQITIHHYFPSAGYFDPGHDSIFVGMRNEQKEQWLSMLMELIVRKEKVQLINHKSQVTFLVILQNATFVKQLTETLKDLKIKNGSMNLLENMSGISLFTSQYPDIQWKSFIIVGELRNIMACVKCKADIFTKVKSVILDLEPTMYPTELSFVSSVEETIQTVQCTAITPPNMVIATPKSTPTLMHMLITKFKSNWRFYAALPKCNLKSQHARDLEIILQINDSDANTERIVVIGTNDEDMVRLSKLSYSISEAEFVHSGLTQKVNDFRGGTKKILFLTLPALSAIDIMSTTKYLNYDMMSGNGYIIAINGQEKIFRIVQS